MPGWPAVPASRLAVVVVTFNSASVIQACLQAIPEAVRGLELTSVVVADNASSDATVALARQALPSVQVVPTGGNLGYSAAINRGAAAAGEHDLLLVLNPDTVPGPGSAAALAEALDDPRRAMAVPMMTDPQGRRADSIRREPSLLTALAEAVLGGRRAARLGLGEIVTEAQRYQVGGPVDWATGAAVLVARRCWERIGGWDESFFLYSEETDYMLRARDAGLGTWYAPQARVAHQGGESSTSARLWALMLANKALLYRRRHSALAAAAYRGALLVGELVRAAAGQPRSRLAVRALTSPAVARRLRQA